MVRLSDDATAPYYGVFATPSTEVHTGREDQHYGFSFVVPPHWLVSPDFGSALFRRYRRARSFRLLPSLHGSIACPSQDASARVNQKPVQVVGQRTRVTRQNGHQLPTQPRGTGPVPHTLVWTWMPHGRDHKPAIIGLLQNELRPLSHRFSSYIARALLPI